MKLLTNTKKEKLNHMLQAAKIINLEVVVGEPFEKEGRPLRDRENRCGLYVKEEDYTEGIKGKYLITVQLLGERELRKWREKGYKLKGANGLQFYIDMPEEKVKEIEYKNFTWVFQKK